MSTGFCSEMSDFSSNDSWTSELGTLQKKTPPGFSPTIPAFPQLYGRDVSRAVSRSSSCSSTESSAPPSPAGVQDTNQSGRSSPVVPPTNSNGNYTLIDLGVNDVERYFTKIERIEPKKETMPPKGNTKQNTVLNKRREAKTMPAKAPPKEQPATPSAGGRKLWEFVLGLLCNPATNPSVVRWTNIQDGVFLFTNSRRAASLWGQRRGHPDMTYEHMSRAIRHYYEKKVILRVAGKRLVYRFGPNAPDWRRRVKAASTGVLLRDLPKDFCDVTTSHKDTTTMSQIAMAITSRHALEVKKEVKPVMDKVCPLQTSSQIAGFCDVDRVIGSGVDSGLTNVEVNQHNFLQEVQEPAQQVPDEDTEIAVPFQHGFDSAIVADSDVQSQHSCASHDFGCIPQSQPGSEKRTGDLQWEVFDDLEFQTGFYDGCTSAGTGLVDSVDMESDTVPQFACGPNDRVSLLCQEQQQQLGTENLPMELSNNYILLQSIGNGFYTQPFNDCQLSENGCQTTQQLDSVNTQPALEDQIEELQRNCSDEEMYNIGWSLRL